METETLSSYEQPQDKHGLVNDMNHDEDSDSLHTNEINNEVDSDMSTEPVSSSCRKDPEENCDETVSSSENKLNNNGDNNTDIGEENDNEECNNSIGTSINSPNVSSTNHEEEEEKDPLSDQEGSSVIDESKPDLKDEEKDKTVQDKSKESSPELENKPDSKNEDNNKSVQDISKESSPELDDSKADSEDEENNKVLLNISNEPSSPECENADPLDDSRADNEKDSSSDVLESSKEDKMEADSVPEDGKETVENENEKSNDNKGESTPKKTDSGEAPEGEDFPLLKETLSKQKDQDGTNDKDVESENGNEEMDMDDDFDPSLLCPDIAMEVDEAPVITTTDHVPTDGNKSPLLYDPVYSTYVDEMTGAEVTFNLSPDEHQMRQDLYGEKNPIQFTKIHCTACNVHLGSALDGQGNRFVHPLLKVLICKDCYHFYTSGEFEKDEDGSELYCRWCGQGGQVMCCSACEMVFCKKCIRINFGRKKLTEIRDSDDWYCFRCNPSQLTELRVHCAEFMEYVRREISRAATLENATSFMTTDYTQCCLAQKKKYVDPNAIEQPKRKRKKFVDPDYDPTVDLVEPKTSDQPADLNMSVTSKVVPILPKTIASGHIPQVTQITQAIPSGTVFKVGNTTFRPRMSTLGQVRPMMAGTSPVRAQSSGPGFIKIMPGGIRASIVRQPAQTFVSSSPRQPPFQQRPIRAAGHSNSGMKHEWFEKTVRAAARVNSNLSYTLTQLNRAQASAGSVEALAVVHNKLQEILSTSINSLIQIRKNLRTEFIAGIKNIRFPPKPPQPRPQPSTSAQDDDVIFVSPTSSPVPPPLALVATNNLPTLNNLTPSVTLTNTSASSKKSSLPIVPTTSLQPIPSISTLSGSGERPKMFLRVKSLSALQNVTSECITIPDDPLPSPPPLTAIESSSVVSLIDDSPNQKKEDPAPKDDVSNDTAEENEEKKSESEASGAEKCDKNSTEDTEVVEVNTDVEQSKEESSTSEKSEEDSPAVLPDKMLNCKVYLERCVEIDELLKNKVGLVNGDASDTSE